MICHILIWNNTIFHIILNIPSSFVFAYENIR